MRVLLAAVPLVTLAAGTGSILAQRAPAPAPKGVRLESRTWVDAQALLRPESVVVIPLGAGLKEHGPHLKLGNDLTLANHFTARVIDAADVVVTPPLTYHFYPAFLEYPGSTSLTLDTARDYTAQVARSLARAGTRRFYVLNTGISTVRPLQAAAAALEAEGILLRFTDFGAAAEQAAARIRQQEGGSHADELETSMMLHIDPSSVDMTKAVRDLSPAVAPFRLTRQKGGTGTYSPTGIWGDPTLATATKGKIIVDGVLETILRDIEALRSAPLPEPRPVTPPPPAAPPAPAPAPPSAPPQEGCLAGDDRTIRRLETTYNVAWLHQDAITLGNLWTDDGDIVHGDGATERGRRTITQNLHERFMRRENRNARHILTFTNVRCITPRVAVVDSKWELRDVTDAAGKVLPRTEGFATLVVQKGTETWSIEAYRYNTKPSAPTAPTLQSKPGYPVIIK